MMPADAMFGREYECIFAFTAARRLPILHAARRTGVLIAYGFDRFEMARLAASYVDRILKGAKPGDLPVQLPTKYLLTVNLGTAKALGLTIPYSILSRADEVIE